MADTTRKIRRESMPGGPARKVDVELEKKGAFFDSDIAKAKKEAKATEKRQKESIARQQQQEQLRVAEAESEIGRRKLLRKTGGRRSLVASR